MRIIGGIFKGKKIFLPVDKSTRPLKDIVRESIFNLLSHSKRIFCEFDKSNILDLYSGTGSFGLECLSRKAKKVFFVEKNKNAIQILKKNIDKLNFKKQAEVFCDDAFQIIQKQKILKIKFNIIFCDPPFKDMNSKKLLELIYKKKLIR